MKIISETSIADFKAWSGAVETKRAIVDAGKEAEFDALIKEFWPDGLTNTELNDMLWLDESLLERLGISEDEEVN
jgi:hypothetical protein